MAIQRWTSYVQMTHYGLLFANPRLRPAFPALILWTVCTAAIFILVFIKLFSQRMTMSPAQAQAQRANRKALTPGDNWPNIPNALIFSSLFWIGFNNDSMRKLSFTIFKILRLCFICVVYCSFNVAGVDARCGSSNASRASFRLRDHLTYDFESNLNAFYQSELR
jgi:hypothetical protein